MVDKPGLVNRVTIEYDNYKVTHVFDFLYFSYILSYRKLIDPSSVLNQSGLDMRGAGNAKKNANDF